MSARRRWQALVGLAAAVGVLAGCSPRYYRNSADREVGGLIASRGRQVPNMDPRFTIEEAPQVPLDGFLRSGAPAEFLGQYGERERDVPVLALKPVLSIAMRESREFQDRKELLYLEALNFTLVQHQFRPNFFGVGEVSLQAGTERVRVGIDAITGEPEAILDAEAALIDEYRVSTALGTGFSWLLATGARLSAAFTTDFLRYLTGDPRSISQSQAVAALIQPLLRGAGSEVALEPLTQGEHDLLYELREFTEFRKVFVVGIAAAYYEVLRNRDEVRNAWSDLQRSRENAERERAFADEGLRSLASMDQLAQNVLTSETRWIQNVRTYLEALDRFKIQLGLPVSQPLILDDREPERLRIEDPGLTVEQALEVALVTRLDLQTERERVEDAERQVRVAANALQTQLDLVVSGNISGQGSTGIELPDYRQYRWNAGLDVDLPFDRVAERNTYRAALIARNRAARQLDLATDTVRLEIVNDARALEQARLDYQNAEVSVKLGDRRVEEQTLRAELGRGTARDLIDAQTDLLRAQNLRTLAIVNHTIGRLQFWRDMGILYVEDSGLWYEHPPARLPAETTAAVTDEDPTPAR